MKAFMICKIIVQSTEITKEQYRMNACVILKQMSIHDN